MRLPWQHRGRNATVMQRLPWQHRGRNVTAMAAAARRLAAPRPQRDCHAADCHGSTEAAMRLHCHAADCHGSTEAAAAWPRERRRAGTHGDARRRGFRGLSDERRNLTFARKTIGCPERSSRPCSPCTPTLAGASSPASQRVPAPLTPTRTSRRVRERTAARSPTCVPLFFFPTHPPCLCGGVSGLCSGADIISDAHAAAAQHKQLRARWTGGALPTSSSSTHAPAAASAARASTAAATAAAAAAATAAASCTTSGGKGRLAVRAA